MSSQIPNTKMRNLKINGKQPTQTERETSPHKVSPSSSTEYVQNFESKWDKTEHINQARKHVQIKLLHAFSFLKLAISALLNCPLS